MGYQSSNPQYNSPFAALLSYKNWASGMIDLDRGYATPLAWIDSLNPSGSFGITDPDGKLIVSYQPRQEVVGEVLSVAQSGANLVVNFVDTQYTGFRPKMMVMDDNKNTAYVVSTIPGQITISPATNPTTLSSASHFTAGRFVTEYGSGSGNYNSTGVANLDKTATARYNYTGITRESLQLSSREKFVSYKGASDGVGYSYVMRERDMLKRFMKKKLLKAIFAEPGQFNSLLEGEVNQTEGLRAAIRNQGGRFIQSATLLSQTQFEDAAEWMATKDPAQFQTYQFIGGRRAWARIMSFYPTAITYSQSRMGADGNIVNFDIAEVTFRGITLKIQTWGLFDDNILFPKISTIAGAGLKESNTFALINLSPVPDAYTGAMIPSVRKFHFGETGGQETLMAMINGMGIGAGESNAVTPMIGRYRMAPSSTMGVELQVAEDSGIDFTADACVWFELAS